ncbi:hypothetical protein [Paraburkholderia lacunae]|uniref:Uncharacterized protein n=1 Tax=Paraburkholderia lacunae TaxID=2211104 RepID=A0A370N2F7_9BURK|nr:hypothetical protein [Paraburkholderia lacunae]RDJ99805.1 hypothetical protein DLM46_26985 [Paraburkholderia lacunae]
MQLLAALALMDAVSGTDAATRAKNADFAETMRLASDRQAELFRLSEKPVVAIEVARRFIRDRDSAMLGMRDAIRLARP